MTLDVVLANTKHHSCLGILRIISAWRWSLAQTLQRLGIALNFRDHHRLKHTSVLKPQWVTEGIYGLLRHA